MDDNERRIADLEQEIEKLPAGYISKKKINGKEQFYRQWNENGKLKSKYIPAAEYDEICRAIEIRKELQKELKELKKTEKKTIPGNNGNTWNPDEIRNAEKNGEAVKTLPEGSGTAVATDYETRVVIGEELLRSCSLVQQFGRRDCFKYLQKYLKSSGFGRVCVIYGLRRTGKTTMLFQAMSELPPEQTVYIKARVMDTMAMLSRDLKKLATDGYRYVFVDEVTLLEDFIDSAAMLSDIYAMQGLKIVLSGTDSLGFWFAEKEELYDRAYTVHTTFIPFREHARLLGIEDIDGYIRYGGTLRAGELDFEDAELSTEDVSFRDDESTRRYIDTAICKNIQHSLACCEGGGHFRHLLDLYEAGELTNAINRIIEDMNKKFLVSVVERRFRSSDLGNTRKNFRRESNPEKQSDALDFIDEQQVLERLKAILDIKEAEEQTVKITPAHIAEIKEYLKALDLIVDCPMRTDASSEPMERVLFTQPGMRYCQAQALVHSLMKDRQFQNLSQREINLVTGRLLDDVKGRLMEDIVLLECFKAAKKTQSVFKLQFDRGEFDMVIYDSEKDACAIYEVKHSDKAVPEQYRHLTDGEMCEKVRHKYGKIAQKTVLYRGKTFNLRPDGDDQDIIFYENAADFLKGLPDTTEILAEELAVYAHLSQAADDIKLGRVQTADSALDSVIADLEKTGS